MLLALVIFIIYYLRDSWKEALTEVFRTSYITLGVIICLAFGYYVIEGGIISMMAKKYESEFGLLDGIRCGYYSSFYRVVTFGSGSGIAEIAYLNKYGIQGAKATGMTLIKYILHKITIVLYGLIGYGIACFTIRDLVRGYGWLLFIGSFIGVGIALILILVTISPWFSNNGFRLVRKIIANKKVWLEKCDALELQVNILQEEAKALLKEKKLLTIIFLNFLKLSLWYLIPGVVCRGEGLTLGLSIILTSISLMLAGSIPAPAGYGSLEIVFILLFGKIISKTKIISVILLYRFATTILPFLVGGLVTFRKIHAAEG